MATQTRGSRRGRGRGEYERTELVILGSGNCVMNGELLQGLN